MKFVINGMKYDTDKMERVATVKKWYKNDSALTQIMFPGQEVGRTYSCELWKSEKLLMEYATTVYERMFGELPEA